MTYPHTGRGGTNTLAVAGVPFFGAAGSAGRVVFGGIREDRQLALHIHFKIPLIPFAKNLNAPTTSIAIDSPERLSFILEHIMNYWATHWFSRTMICHHILEERRMSGARTTTLA